MQFDATRGTGLRALVDYFGASWPLSEWLVSDLSCGVWRPHQVASELLSQLDPQACGTATERVSQEDGAYDPRMIGAGIDAEARGDRVTSDAWMRASRVAGAIAAGPARLLVVLAPIDGSDWEADNSRFLYFLGHALLDAPSRLVLVCTGDTLPADATWTVRWRDLDGGRDNTRRSDSLAAIVPGVIDPAVWEELQTFGDHADLDVLALPGGQRVVPFEARPERGQVSPLQFDRLAVAAPHLGWLRAYAQYHGNNLYVDRQFLARQAWRHHADGSTPLAVRLLARARECGRSATEQASIDAQAQGMHIATHRFDCAAAQLLPGPEVPAHLRGFLVQTKGWGLVMSGRPEEALQHLDAAGRLLDPASLEYLYLLNIRALTELRLGHWDAAHQLECAVEEAHRARSPHDWRLHYVNMLNLARLYRRRHAWSDAERCYEAAFETNDGVRSDSDLIYRNVCLAQLADARALRTEAFAAWLRACLHWVATQVPEAVSARLVQALAHREVEWPERCEAVSNALLTSLRAAAEASRLESGSAVATDSREQVPAFARLDLVSSGTIDAASLVGVGADGWSVFASGTRIPAAIEGDACRRLRGLLHHLLLQGNPTAALRNASTILVDDGLGSEMPTTSAQLLDACLRTGVIEAISGSETFHLPPSAASELLPRLRVSLHRAVDALVGESEEAGTVIFRRMLVPHRCSASQRRLLQALRDRPLLPALAERTGTASLDALYREVRLLERQRMVHVSLEVDADVCTRLVSSCVRA